MIDHHLSFIQLCDSNFPMGSFSHSFGLETYIQREVVHDVASFEKWLQVYGHEQLVSTEGLATRMAYEFLQEEDLEELWQLDHLLTIQNLARESRDGTQRMGERMLDISYSIYEIPMLLTYKKKVDLKEVYGHPAIVFAIIGHELGLDKQTTILYYLYSTVTSLVQNAVRAIPLGQTAGQKIIYKYQNDLQQMTDKIMQMEKDEFGVVSPGLELSQMQHEHVGIRIFSS